MFKLVNEPAWTQIDFPKQHDIIDAMHYYRKLDAKDLTKFVQSVLHLKSAEVAERFSTVAICRRLMARGFVPFPEKEAKSYKLKEEEFIDYLNKPHVDNGAIVVSEKTGKEIVRAKVQESEESTETGAEPGSAVPVKAPSNDVSVRANKDRDEDTDEVSEDSSVPEMYKSPDGGGSFKLGDIATVVTAPKEEDEKPAAPVRKKRAARTAPDPKPVKPAKVTPVKTETPAKKPTRANNATKAKTPPKPEVKLNKDGSVPKRRGRPPKLDANGNRVNAVKAAAPTLNKDGTPRKPRSDKGKTRTPPATARKAAKKKAAKKK